MSTARAVSTPTWRTSTGRDARGRRLRRNASERRSVRAFRGAEIPDDFLEAAKNGMGTFMERVRGRRSRARVENVETEDARGRCLSRLF